MQHGELARNEPFAHKDLYFRVVLTLVSTQGGD